MVFNKFKCHNYQSMSCCEDSEREKIVIESRNVLNFLMERIRRSATDIDSGIDNEYDDISRCLKISSNNSSKPILQKYRSTFLKKAKSIQKSPSLASLYWKRWRRRFVKKSILCLMGQKRNKDATLFNSCKSSKRKYVRRNPNRRVENHDYSRERRRTHRACRGGRGKRKRKSNEVTDFLKNSNQWDAVRVLNEKSRRNKIDFSAKGKNTKEKMALESSTRKQTNRISKYEIKSEYGQWDEHENKRTKDNSSARRKYANPEVPSEFSIKMKYSALTKLEQERHRTDVNQMKNIRCKKESVRNRNPEEFETKRQGANRQQLTKSNPTDANTENESYLHDIFVSTGAIFDPSVTDIDTSPATVCRNMEDLDTFIRRKVDLQNFIKDHQQQKAYFKWSAEKCAGIESKKRWRLLRLQKRLQKINEKICSIDVELCQETILSNVPKIVTL
uniref:uncharacterized protein LOC120326505 n=1 Tax=Styela clava TaxID=7725 RepID=UPI00193ADE1C|nr:uncharacterized protein LOC120326505 [Styela clava]